MWQVIVEIQGRQLWLVVLSVKRNFGDRRVMHEVLVAKRRSRIHQSGQQMRYRRAMADKNDVFARMPISNLFQHTGHAISELVGRFAVMPAKIVMNL